MFQGLSGSWHLDAGGDGEGAMGRGITGVGEGAQEGGGGEAELGGSPTGAIRICGYCVLSFPGYYSRVSE